MRQWIKTARAKPAVDGIVHRDIVYRREPLRCRTLDIYEPTANHPHPQAPAVVFLHGGSWLHGDKVTIRIIDRYLARMRASGYYVIAVNYTTHVIRGIGGPLENVHRALDWIVAHSEDYGYDPFGIGIYGVSAGGHLALLAASRRTGIERHLAFVFAECSPTDLVGLRNGETCGNAWVFRLFSHARLRVLSPVTHVHAGLPPVLLFHGDEDRMVDISQSIRYARALESVGGTVELVEYPGGNHAFLNFTDDMWERQETRALDFFERQFRRAAADTTPV